MKDAVTLPDEFDLHDMDQLSIMAEHELQRVAIKLGLMCTLYVPDPHDADTRQRLAACGDEYLALFGSHLHLYQDPSGSGAMKAYPRKGVSLGKFLADGNDSSLPFTPSFTGAAMARDASSYSLVVTAPGTKYFAPGEIPGSFSASFPVSYVLDRANGTGTPGFQELVLGWCKRLQPESGYAGLGFIQSIDWAEKLRTIRQVSGLAARFPGLEVDNPDIICNHVQGRIKGVNWLTIVCDALLNQVGGRQAIASQLDGRSSPVLDYGGGIIIQAGPSPQIGDRNRQRGLAQYKQVSRLLKPVRMQFPEQDTLLDLGDGRDTEVTNQWLSRFD